jgi:hypothetical protein
MRKMRYGVMRRNLLYLYLYRHMPYAMYIQPYTLCLCGPPIAWYMVQRYQKPEEYGDLDLAGSSASALSIRPKMGHRILCRILGHRIGGPATYAPT